MPRPPPAMKKPSHKPAATPLPTPEGERWAWVTALAFALALALACARGMMTEELRAPFEPRPGVAAPPHNAGPATSLFLNLLCCVPALLVLLRRAFDPQYVVRWSRGHAVLGLLAVWLALSITWASDRFTAMVEASHLIAAIALLWAMSQLVRSWLRLRLVAGAAFGLLLVLVAYGLNYRLIDHPEAVRQWKSGDADNPNSREAYLRQRPELSPDDFQVEQIEKKLLSGELGGFSRSPNTYAAMLVMLTMVVAGVAAQRLSCRDPLLSILPIALAAPALLFVLYHTHSLTAAVTTAAGLATLALLAAGGVRRWLGAHPRLAYGVAVVLFVLGSAAVIGHGMYHNSLFIQTLTFRWYYWRGAAAMVAERPWLGVGWGNFGLYYPRYRLPLAVEEVKDPHNLFVRGFAELGAVGGVLFILFALWIWWALTRPVTPPQAGGAATPQGGSRARAGLWLLGLPTLAGAFHLVLAHDWDYPNSSWLFLGAMASVGYALLLGLGLVIVAVRGISMPWIDERPAPWVLYGVIVALAVFCLHNLIDFSLFETGPMFMSAVLAGSALGLRQPSVAGRPRRTAAAIIVFCLATLLWVLTLGAAWLPTLLAEGKARHGEELVRGSAAEGTATVDATKLSAAQTYYRLASEQLPLNSEYAARAAAAAQMAGNPSDLFTRGMIAKAISTNPEEVKHRLQLARHLAGRQPPNVDDVKLAYEQALARDPRSVSIHLEYAETLEKLGDRELALDRYRHALRLDDELPEKEVRRLPATRRKHLEQKVSGLSADKAP